MTRRMRQQAGPNTARSGPSIRVPGLQASLIVLAATAIVFAAAGSGSVLTGVARQPAQMLSHVGRATFDSLNWSGYATKAHTYSDVKGTWTQPAIVGSCSKKTTLAAFYVGIDGYGSSTVEQIGTEDDCLSGTPTYLGWYEMYPAPTVYLSQTTNPVAPGDVIASEVKWTASSRHSSAHFTLSLSDNGAGNGKSWSYLTTISDTGLSRSSAEWIAESPVTGGHFWPLTDFGSVAFSNATATPDGGSATDISGLSPDELIMVTRNGVIRANPQGSLTDGSYTDTWFRS